MTGRAAGWCAGYDRPGYAHRAPGFGWGRGLGGGRGWRNWYYATGLPGWARAGYGAPVPPGPFTPEQELAALKTQASWLGDQLTRIQQRIAELEGQRNEERP